MCSSCLTRCSRVARYCHHCATPLVADADAGTATDFGCPHCGTDRNLTSRRVENLTFLECPGCAGLWLEHSTISHVTRRARAEAAPYDPVALRHALTEFRAGLKQKPIVYHPCPVCLTQMGRTNWGHASGVVVDQCPQHGIWFDHGELEHILAWIRAGGEQRAKAIAEHERSVDRRVATTPGMQISESTPAFLDSRHEERPLPGGTWVEALIELVKAAFVVLLTLGPPL